MMSRKTVATITCFAAGVIVCANTYLRAASSDQDLETRKISLEEVHAIVPVPPMQNVHDTFRAESDRIAQERGERYAMQESLNEVRRHPGTAPDVYLVEGKDIWQAVYITHRLATRGDCALTAPALLSHDRMDVPLWLVVHLGPGSGTPTMQITEIEVTANRIVVRCERIKSIGVVTTDWKHYLYWAPLGTLKPGTYTLELWDIDRGAATITRLVEIAAPK